MKVTIKDVAREAQVATSTVSRVLANSRKISEETKERVNEAIKKLNYTPSIVARGLANNRTRILAVLLPGGAEVSFENPFFVQAMKGISMYAEKEDYYIMYAFKDKKADEEEWVKKVTEGNLIDGLCLFNVKDNDITINYLKKKQFPFVVIGRPEQIDGVLWVDNDNFAAVYNLTQKLIERGNKTIAFIGAKSDINVSKDRLNGYKQAMYSRNIEIDNELIIEMNDRKLIDLKKLQQELNYIQFELIDNFNNIVSLCNGTGYDKETLVYVELEEGKYVIKLIPVKDSYSYIYTYKR